jgi:hypothetical protein
MGVLKIVLEFDWVPKWPRTDMGTEVFCRMLLGWGHMNIYIYICIYIEDEIHIERVTYIYRERNRERDRGIERERRRDSCCNIPHPYLYPPPGNTEKQTHGH